MTEQTFIPFNVNNRVRIRLNDKGRAIYREAYEAVSIRVHGEYRPKKEDAEGWSEWQLWEVMELFGPHIHLGCHMPFENCTIQFSVQP